MHYLYLITNGKSGKMYIGQTVNPKDRWTNHKSQINYPKQYIHRAMAKYGVNNFTFTIIDCALDRWQAGCIEKCLIEHYQTLNPNKGYNLVPGGYCDPITPKRRQALTAGHRKYCADRKAQGLPIPGAYQNGHKQTPNSGSFQKGNQINKGRKRTDVSERNRKLNPIMKWHTGHKKKVPNCI